MFLLAFVPGLVAGAGLVIAFHENPEVEQRESQTRIEKPFVRNEETKPTVPEVTLAMKPATPKVKGDDKGCVFKTVLVKNLRTTILFTRRH